MADYQDGESRNIGGVTYTRQGGQWIASQGEPGPVYGAPKPVPAPTPKTPEEARGERLRNDRTAQEIYDHDHPNSEDTFDPQTTKFYAQQVLAGGAMPAFGMGKTGAANRRQVMEEVARQAGASGTSGGDLATQIAHYKAGQKQISTLENQFGTTQQNERTALANGQQFMDRSAELPGQTSMPIVNSIVQAAQRNLPVPGHATMAAMDAAWGTFVNEYAKVVSGSPTGGGTLSDSARHEAMATMQGNYSLEQKEAAFAQMKADMANRMSAMNQTIGDAYTNLTKRPGQEHGAVPGLVPGSDAAPPGGDGSAPPMAPTTNGSKSVIDPRLTGVRREYMQRLEAGQAPGEIVAFLRQAGINDPQLLATAGRQAAFRRKNPNTPVSQYDTSAIDTMDKPLSAMESAINSAAQSAPGAYVMHAANAVTGNSLDSIMGATGGNAERTRLALSDAGRSSPVASFAGDMSGGVMAALGGEAALARGGMSAGLGRTMLADGAYGAAAGAGSADDGSRLGGAALGGLAGLGGSLAGQGLNRATSAVLRGVTDPAVRYASSTGVPLTVGQAVGNSGMVGRAVKGVEDRIAGLPGVGDIVNARRGEGMRVMNSKAFDKALEPINATVGDKVGEQAVSEAHDQVQQAFKRALNGKTAQTDAAFFGEARRALQRLATIRRDGLGQEIVGQIEEATKGYIDPATGQLTGENMQALLGSLRQIRQAYKQDPLGHRIDGSIRQIEGAVEGMFERQAPEVMPQYTKAKAAYRRLSILSDAVNRGKNNDGAFTAGQLGMADRTNAKKYDGAISAASGNSPFHDFQRNMQSVLPNRVPDSGTAGRAALLMAPAALSGAGAGLGYAAGDAQGGAEKGLGLAGILAAAYTRTGQRALTAMVLKRGPASRALANQVAKRARITGAAGAALTGTSGDQ